MLDSLKGLFRREAPEAEEREISAFFVNLDSYVGIAEKLPRSDLPKFMNRYYGLCTDVIEAAGGTLDKFVGDAVVAMFGAPHDLKGHAYHACAAAIMIQGQLGKFESALRAEGILPASIPPLRIRIGIHTGIAIVGNMGTSTRFQYTMFGDSVNLAARLEAAARSLSAGSVCSKATKDACEVLQPGRVRFRPLGRLAVGQSAPIEMFEPLALLR